MRCVCIPLPGVSSGRGTRTGQAGPSPAPRSPSGSSAGRWGVPWACAPAQPRGGGEAETHRLSPWQPPAASWARSSTWKVGDKAVPGDGAACTESASSALALRLLGGWGRVLAARHPLLQPQPRNPSPACCGGGGAGSRPLLGGAEHCPPLTHGNSDVPQDQVLLPLSAGHTFRGWSPGSLTRPMDHR